jgi:hypothetical protein
MYRSYSVFTPEFDPLSGGIRVMWALCGWLLAKGQIALTNVKFTDDFVAIYPEIVHGNPFNAKRVIRYILNKPGVMASYGVKGPTVFDKNDQIYVFSRIYDTFGVDESHLLFLPVLNLHIFKDYKRKRPNTCYFVGKGKDLGLHPKEAIKIDRSNSSNQGQLAEVLNSCSVMYSYENPTAMLEIARLCGCRVVFFPEGARFKYTEKELKEKYEPGMDGVGWGKEVDLDVKGFRERYKGLIDTFEKKLDRFIYQTQL